MKKFLKRCLSLIMALVIAVSFAVMLTGCSEDYLGHYAWDIIIKWRDYPGHSSIYRYIYYKFDLSVYHTDNNEYEFTFYGNKVMDLYQKDAIEFGVPIVEKDNDFNPNLDMKISKTYSEGEFKGFSEGDQIEFERNRILNLIYKNGNRFVVTLNSGKTASKGSKAIMDWYVGKTYICSGNPYASEFVPNSNYVG